MFVPSEWMRDNFDCYCHIGKLVFNVWLPDYLGRIGGLIIKTLQHENSFSVTYFNKDIDNLINALIYYLSLVFIANYTPL